MKWSIKNKVIDSLIINDENLINPWGVETSDTSAFYSLEDSIGYRFDIEEEDEVVDEGIHTYNALIRMKDGAFELNLKEELQGSKVLRSVTLNVLEDLPLMDFVLRFRFKDGYFKKAEISGNNFTADNSNIYHQFSTDEVKLLGERYNILVKVVEFVAPDRFEQNMYVRSRNKEWIIHARMIPKFSERSVIKLCSIWFMTRPIPKFLSDILLKSSYIKKMLWYRGERNPFKSRLMRVFNPNAFPMIELKKGDLLKWKVECIVSER
ncbi:hypothetical protein A9Q84_04555 [Halobacteriovorax marinus]|uniref:Uncharacterized protein n=1 Tax=Halobacteriovorax marinus TaxID=97084 RepID=A0A1Y5FAJ3_9BACT|nr:hypothetical protein A9Q84_04555 [Halobacteriovorax marinus]